MISSLKTLFVVLCVSILTACSTPGHNVDGCAGSILEVPDALVETIDSKILAEAIGQPEKGALCKAKVFEALKPVTVYRVWDESKSFTLYGRWWSLLVPVGPREAYQAQNAICPEWSVLNKMSACTLKIGTRVAIGPGQSARCADSLLAASPVNQVFVPNDSRNDELMVENCSAGEDWPQAQQ